MTLTGGYSQTSSGALDIGSLSSFDLFKVNDTATPNGTLNLSCSGACSITVDEEITIPDANANGLSGAFASLALSGFASGAFDVLYDVANGDVKLRVTESVSAVPLPAGVWLMLSGLGATGALRRRAG